MPSPDYVVCHCDAVYNVGDILGCALTTVYTICDFTSQKVIPLLRILRVGCECFTSNWNSHLIKNLQTEGISGYLEQDVIYNQDAA